MVITNFNLTIVTFSCNFEFYIRVLSLLLANLTSSSELRVYTYKCIFQLKKVRIVSYQLKIARSLNCEIKSHNYLYFLVFIPWHKQASSLLDTVYTVYIHDTVYIVLLHTQLS